MAIGPRVEQAFAVSWAQQAAPLALVEFLPIRNTQLAGDPGAEPGGAGTEQHIQHMGGAEALAECGTRPRGPFLGCTSLQPAPWGSRATVAVHRQGQRFAEVGEQHRRRQRRFGEADQRFGFFVLQRFSGRLGAGVVDKRRSCGHVACPMHHPRPLWQSVAAGAAVSWYKALQDSWAGRRGRRRRTSVFVDCPCHRANPRYVALPSAPPDLAASHAGKERTSLSDATARICAAASAPGVDKPPRVVRRRPQLGGESDPPAARAA